MSWSTDSFWKAVREGKEPIAEFFLRHGMEVEAFRLHNLLLDREAVRSASLEPIIKYREQWFARFCRSDSDGPDASRHGELRNTNRFFDYALEPKGAEFVRRYCTGHDIVSPLKARLAKVRDENSRAANANAHDLTLEAACKADLSRQEVMKKFNEAGTVCTEASIQAGFQQGFCKWFRENPPVQQGESPWNSTIERFCAVKALRPVDREMEDRLKHAIEKLGG